MSSAKVAAGTHSLPAEHHTPTYLLRPLYHRRIVDMCTHDEVIGEIDYQLTEDDGKLVPGNKCAAFVCRRYLSNIHRADCRSQADAYAAEDAVAVKDFQQGLGGYAVRQYTCFRRIGSQRGDEEQHAGDEERSLASQTRREHAGEKRSDDASDERTTGGKTMPEMGVGKVFRAAKELL